MHRRSPRRSPYLFAAIDFGYMLLASLGLFGGLGWWLDGRFNTAPLFLIAGILLGLAVAFRSLLRQLNAIERALQAARKEGDRQQTPEGKP